MTTNPDTEDADHEDGRLMHDIAALNTKLARYLFRFMDADAGRADPVAVDDERTLAKELNELAARMQARADRRAASPKLPLVIDGVSLKQLTNGNQTEQRS